MSGSTRRNFLIASGAGAAAVGAAAALPAVADASTAVKPTRLPDNATALVAHVLDPASGTVALFVGEREVTVHDPDLVARLAQAAAHISSKEA